MNNVITICATVLAIVFCTLLTLHGLGILPWYNLIIGGSILVYTLRNILPNKHDKLDIVMVIFEAIMLLFK